MQRLQLRAVFLILRLTDIRLRCMLCKVLREVREIRECLCDCFTLRRVVLLPEVKHLT